MKTVLITGASSGIGHATAIALAERGHQVIATARNKPKFASGTNIESLSLDVTDKPSIFAATNALEKRPIDVLVNNAGYAEIGPIEDLTIERFKAQFETNVFGVVRMIQAILPGMRARRMGRIVNVSSVAGRIAYPFMGAYCASKFALEGLSDALRLELSVFGIDVVLVEPGAIASPFNNAAGQALDGSSPRTGAWEGYFDRTKLMRMTELRASPVADAADAVIAAVCDDKPPARSAMPARARRQLMLNRILPTSVFDRLILSSTGLAR